MDVKVSSWNHRFPTIPTNTEWLSAQVWLWVWSDNVRSLAMSWPFSLLIDSLISQRPFQISLTIYNWIMITVQSQVLPVSCFRLVFFLKEKNSTGEEEERFKFCVCVCPYIGLYTLNKIINGTLLFLPPFFMCWTQRSKTFSMYTKGLFLSNIVHKSV